MGFVGQTGVSAQRGYEYTEGRCSGFGHVDILQDASHTERAPAFGAWDLRVGVTDHTVALWKKTAHAYNSIACCERVMNMIILRIANCYSARFLVEDR